MSKDAYVDCDVILDLLSKRLPFYESAAVLFTLADEGRIRLWSSPLAFANIFYILRKHLGNESAMNLLRKLRVLVGVMEMNDKTVDLALNAGMTDFEDSLQYFSARACGVEAIITRNKRDYTEKGIPVFTPDEYLVSLHAMEE